MYEKLFGFFALAAVVTVASSAPGQIEEADSAVLTPEYLRDVIVKGYARGEANVTALLELVRSLPWPHLQVTGYEAIYDAINQQNQAAESAEIFQLAYNIKESSSNSKYDKFEEPLKARLEDLKSKMPTVVKRIVFGGPSCSLKNKNFDTYLFAASDRFKFNNETRRVFLRKSGSEGIVLWPQEYWNLETLDEGESWIIRSPHFRGEYLHAVTGLEGQADEDRRRTGTFKNLKAGGSWKLKPEVGGRYVSILNAETSEYMYAAYSDFDGERRYVYTWIPKGHSVKSDDQSLWEVKCPL